MTYTIELDAVEERVLAAAAAARGVDVDTYLHQAAREMAALDAAEDAEDLEDARRVLAETPRADYVSWDAVKNELRI